MRISDCSSDVCSADLPATDVCAWALRRSCAWPAVRLNATGRPLAGHCDRITGSAIQLLTIAAHFEASDRAVVNLIRPIHQAHCAEMCIGARKAEVVGDARAAMRLDRNVGALQRHMRTRPLDHPDFRLCCLGPKLVPHAGHLEASAGGT